MPIPGNRQGSSADGGARSVLAGLDGLLAAVEFGRMRAGWRQGKDGKRAARGGTPWTPCLRLQSAKRFYLRRISVVMTRQLAVSFTVTSPVMRPTSPAAAASDPVSLFSAS